MQGLGPAVAQVAVGLSKSQLKPYKCCTPTPGQSGEIVLFLGFGISLLNKFNFQILNCISSLQTIILTRIFSKLRSEQSNGIL